MLNEAVLLYMNTFDEVLAICDQAGSADEALNIFQLITQKYNMSASKEQFSLTAGLLSSLGHTEENQSSCSVPAPGVSFKRKRDHPSEYEYVSPVVAAEPPCPFEVRGVSEPVVLQPVKPGSATASVKAPSLLNMSTSSLKTLPVESDLTPDHAEDYCHSLLCKHLKAVNPSLPVESASILCPIEARGASESVVLQPVKPNNVTAAVDPPSPLTQLVQAACWSDFDMSQYIPFPEDPDLALPDEPELNPKQAKEFCNSLFNEDLEDINPILPEETALTPQSVTSGRELFRMGKAVLEDFEKWWEAEGQYQESKKQID